MELHAVPPDPPLAFEFLDVEPNVAALILETPARIRLTPMGQVLISGLFDKVGFTWGRAHDLYLRSERPKDTGISYFDLRSADRARIYFDYLRLLAVKHLRYLAMIMPTSEPRERYWLEMYRAAFGMSNKMHVERLCGSAAVFYDPILNMDVNPFVALARDYEALVDRLAEGARWDERTVARLNRSFETYE